MENCDLWSNIGCEVRSEDVMVAVETLLVIRELWRPAVLRASQPGHDVPGCPPLPLPPPRPLLSSPAEQQPGGQSAEILWLAAVCTRGQLVRTPGGLPGHLHQAGNDADGEGGDDGVWCRSSTELTRCGLCSSRTLCPRHTTVTVTVTVTGSPACCRRRHTPPVTSWRRLSGPGRLATRTWSGGSSSTSCQRRTRSTSRWWGSAGVTGPTTSVAAPGRARSLSAGSSTSTTSWSSSVWPARSSSTPSASPPAAPATSSTSNTNNRQQSTSSRNFTLLCAIVERNNGAENS